MKLCCGEVPYTNYDEQSGYCMWCRKCHKTLTATYSFSEEAQFAWEHGPEGLPGRCPFCSFPAKIYEPLSSKPKFGCHMAMGSFCPLGGLTFLPELWPKPAVWRTEALAKRWEKKPEFKKALQALKRALKQDQQGR